MDGAGGDEDLKHVRLTGYGKRDTFDGPKGESIWHQSPLFKNGAYGKPMCDFLWNYLSLKEIQSLIKKVKCKWGNVN